MKRITCEHLIRNTKVYGVRNLPIFAFSLAWMLAGSVSAAHAGVVLPTGGTVRTGSAVISSPNASTVQIDQTSNNAIITWSQFSIGQGNLVQFNNGSGATLNRVAPGADMTEINGQLSATGSVYLINPSGVIVGSSGVVNVGGTFVASTLDVPDARFLAGGNLTFTGPSAGSVINYGSIGALGGDVVLMAGTVANHGTISAPNGDAGLLAGTTVLLQDTAGDNGKFIVQVGDTGTSALNDGSIAAAMVELRANNGNVFALAGNTGGMINATGVSTDDGKVFLVSNNEHTIVSGPISATSSDGTGGTVATSGYDVVFTGASVTAGKWIIQADSLDLGPSMIPTIESNLATTSISLIASGYSDGSGGSINVLDPITWSSNNSLGLAAYRAVTLRPNVFITSSGGANVSLVAGESGNGAGDVNFFAGSGVSTSGKVAIFYNPINNDSTSVNSSSFTTPTNYTANVTGGATLSTYMLINNTYDLQNIQNNLSADYALSTNINAANTANWNTGSGFQPVGTSSAPFTGILDGRGFAISGLTIDSPSSTSSGLFGVISNAKVAELLITDASIKGGSVTGVLAGTSNTSKIIDVVTSGAVNSASGDVAGGLIGQSNTDTITGSSSSANVNAVDYAGGLVGQTTNSHITSSSASGDVLVTGNYAGGLVGDNGGLLDNTSASGSVTGSSGVGGLVGLNSGKGKVVSVNASFASGSVSADGSAGGLVGVNAGGAIDRSYWDIDTTGQGNPVGVDAGTEPNLTGVGGTSGLSPFSSASYPYLDFTSAGAWTIDEGFSLPSAKPRIAIATTIGN